THRHLAPDTSTATGFLQCAPGYLAGAAARLAAGPGTQRRVQGRGHHPDDTQYRRNRCRERMKHRITIELTGARMGAALAALGLAAIVGSARAAEHTAIKRAFNLPPSADLHYTIRAGQKGLKLDGSALVKWRSAEGSYSVSSEMRAAILGKILENRS